MTVRAFTPRLRARQHTRSHSEHNMDSMQRRIPHVFAEGALVGDGADRAARRVVLLKRRALAAELVRALAAAARAESTRPTRRRCAASAGSGRRATLAERRDARARASFCSATGPMPGNFRTGSGPRKSSSVPAGTSSTPRGLARPLATLATERLVAMPALDGKPTRAWISSVSSRTTRSMVASGAASPACEYRLSQPEKSRNISSMLATCETGV